MESFYIFLAEELKDVMEECENASQIAHQICVLLSVDGYPIPETFFRLYTSHIEVDYAIMNNAAAYFMGAGMLNIQCDCSDSDKPLCDIAALDGSDFYHAGMKDKFDGSQKIDKTHAHIEHLRGCLLNAD